MQNFLCIFKIKVKHQDILYVWQDTAGPISRFMKPSPHECQWESFKSINLDNLCGFSPAMTLLQDSSEDFSVLDYLVWAL